MTSNTSRSLLWTGLLALTFFSTGCPKAADPGADSKPAEVKTGDATTTKKLRIAVIPKGVAQSFWQTVKAGAEKAAAENNCEIIFQGPSQDADTVQQKAIVEAQIASKVDAITLAACSSEGLVDTVKKAQDAGIPVITFDSGITPNTTVKYIASDNVKGGAAAADALAKMLGEAGGEVGLLPFIQGSVSSDEREKGFIEALKAYPKIKLVSTLYSNSDVNVAQEKVNAMMTANPKLKGIFAANQNGAVGAAQAVKQKGMGDKIKVVAYDASEEEIDALKNNIVQALVVQRPFEMGYQCVKAAIEAIKTKTIKADKAAFVDTGVTVVTNENFNDPTVQQLLYPK